MPEDTAHPQPIAGAPSPEANPPAPGWTVRDAATLYGIEAWGRGRIAVCENGHLLVRPDRSALRQVDLHELVEGLVQRGIHAPMLLRFPDLLRRRLADLRSAFDDAIREQGYGGSYRCVYPVKVNQNRAVCEEVRDFGTEHGFGLEAGSKAELLAVLGLTADHPEMPVTCNGFKDEQYIEAVVLATKLGRNITPIVERPRELDLIVRQAERHGVRPRIGVRIKPSAVSSGKWSGSAGQRSKFGLRPHELLEALAELQSHGMGDCLRMIHFHLGSQLSDIRSISSAVKELARTYAHLRELGAGLDTINLGGGLAVDYDGSNTATDSSMNYTLQEYAADVVHRVKSVCDEEGVPHPDLMSESGRAMVATASVLVVEAMGRSGFDADPSPGPVLDELEQRGHTESDLPQPVADLLDAARRTPQDDPVEAYHDAVQARDEALSLYQLGHLSLPLRAAADRLFWQACRRAIAHAERAGVSSEELDALRESMADTYFINASVFQSLPDSWAIGQLFPVCPIHRLDERPARRAVLGDMTCDSDGRLDRFVDPETSATKSTLELHELAFRPDGAAEPYRLGVFLVGAYQEVLGDLHNLFGDTHAVHVSILEDGRWTVDEFVPGDTVREVLSYVQFDAEQLTRTMRRSVERSMRDGTLSVAEGRILTEFYEQGLQGYTYLE